MKSRGESRVYNLENNEQFVSKYPEVGGIILFRDRLIW